MCHSYVLEAVADLAQQGHFLGAWSLVRETPEARLFLEAVAYVNEKTPEHQSIVSTSVASALEGHFGDYHATRRTARSRLFINPLMTLYWAFRLSGVAQRVQYLDRLLETDTLTEVSRAIKDFRETLPATRPRVDLPL
jgi:hypothetical protein